MNKTIKAKPDEFGARRVFAPRTVQATKYIITSVLIFWQRDSGTLNTLLHTKVS